VLEGKRSIEVEAMVVEHVGLGRHAVVAPRASSTRVEGNGGDVDEWMKRWQCGSLRFGSGSAPILNLEPDLGPVREGSALNHGNTTFSCFFFLAGNLRSHAVAGLWLWITVVDVVCVMFGLWLMVCGAVTGTKLSTLHLVLLSGT
jgi:hypothetical protein